MKLKMFLKSVIAGVTAFAMSVTMLPASGLGTVWAASTDSSMILHWDMTANEDGTLKDLTGNNHSGIKNGSVENSQIDGIDVLDMKGGYVDIPDGTIGTDMTEVTVNMLVKITENIPASWMWCLGSSNTKYMYFTGCCSENQGSKMRGGIGYGSPGWSHETAITGTAALEAEQWQNITVTYKDKGNFIFYRNGEKRQTLDTTSGSADAFVLQDLMTANDGRDGYMGWSFYTGEDPKFQGKVADFRIYNKEMSETEVSELYTEIDEMLQSLAMGDFTAADVHLAEEDCLGSNDSKDNITTDLSLPASTTIGEKDLEGQITKWVSSNPEIIANDGKVTRPLFEQEVTMTATVERNGASADVALVFKLPGTATPDDMAQIDAESITIPNQNDIRGNITLPDKGEHGSAITWVSSNNDVINPESNGSILPGQVTRQKEDTTVTLTASVVNGDSAVKKKELICTVKKAYDMPELTDYLFAYFPYVDTGVKDERIYFGIGEDGLNFKSLNDEKPVLESTLGTHGLRDPFILRSPEGDRFYLIATDLTVAGITQNGTEYPGQGWGENQTKGSQKIMVWESTDLVNWSEQRECKIAADDAGCTWAPEAYWDDEAGQYVVFWASKTSVDNYNKQRVFFATTRDFYTFSEPQVWIEAEGSVIDTTVIKSGDYYYRYTKNESGETINGTPGKRVYCERSKSLTSLEWERVHNNSLAYSGGQIEGPCIFKLNDDDVENAKKIASLKDIVLTGDDMFCLIADATGVTIFPGLSDDITQGNFNILGETKGASVGNTVLYTMPEPAASHGTIMPITGEEYHNLMKKYNADYAAAADEFYQKAEEAAASFEPDIPSEISWDKTQITLPVSAENGAEVTWKSSNEEVISTDGKVTHVNGQDTTVKLTAVITLKTGSEAVRDQVRRKYYTVIVKKSISTEALTEIADEALAAVTLPETATADLTLPQTSKDLSITWKSDKPEVISAEGKVTRPLNADEEVTLTASVTAKGDGTIADVTREKEFIITVKRVVTTEGLTKIAEEALAAISLPETVTADITLPSTSRELAVTWKSDKPEILSAEGKVTRPLDADEQVKLTASVTAKGEGSVADVTKEKEFMITVTKEEGTVPPVTKEELEQKAEEALAAISLPETAVTDITLPSTSKGLAVTWISDKPEILSASGKVTRPLSTDERVKLTASVTVQGEGSVADVTKEKEFMITVTKEEGTVPPVTKEELEQKAEEALAGISLPETAVTDITLPSTSKGLAVTWTSDKPEIISASGKVTRPLNADERVKLTASVTAQGEGSVADVTKEKEFIITVPKEEGTVPPVTKEELEQKAEEALAAISLPETAVTDITLPSTSKELAVSWKSDKPEFISASGKVTRPLNADERVKLTASITVQGEGSVTDVTKEKEFIITVPKEEGTVPPVTKEELEQIAEEALAAISLPETAVTDITLPSTSKELAVSWKSDKPEIISTAGKVTRPLNADERVKLTASVTAQGEGSVADVTKEREFIIVVKKAEAVQPVIQKYIVKFDSKGGTAVSQKTVEKGKNVAEPKKPVKKGYTFAGWYYGKQKYNFKSAVTKNLTLTAKWTKVTVKTPKAPKLKNTKNKLVITVKKVKGANGYQFTYSTNKKFKKGKSTMVKTTKKNTLTIKKPKKGKTYYVKVKAYKKDSAKKNVFSKKFSKTVKIKIKR